MEERQENERPHEDLRSRQRDFLKLSRRGDISSAVHSNRFGAEEAALGQQIDFVITHLEAYRDEKLKQNILLWLQIKPEPEKMDEFLSLVEDLRVEANHFGLIGLRKLLVKNPVDQVQFIIDHNSLSKIMQHARNDSYPHLVLEAAWCIANLCMGTSQQLDFLIQKNIIPLLLEVSRSKYPQISEQALWGLGNIACDSPATRRKIISSDAMAALREIYERGAQNLCKLVCWIFSSVCKHREKDEPIRTLQIPIRTLVEEIDKKENVNVADLSDCFVGLRSCVKKENLLVFEKSTEFLPKLVAFFREALEDPEKFSVGLTASIFIFGGLTNADSMFSERLIGLGVLTDLKKCLLGELSLKIQKDICWVISNIVLSTEEAVKAFLSEPGLLEAVFRIADSAPYELRREACWIICNLSKAKNQAIHFELIGKGFFEMISNALDRGELEETLALEAIYAQLVFFHRTNSHKELINLMAQKGVVERLAKRQESQDISIYYLAKKILTKFFDLEL